MFEAFLPDLNLKSYEIEGSKHRNLKRNELSKSHRHGYLRWLSEEGTKGELVADSEGIHLNKGDVFQNQT